MVPILHGINKEKFNEGKTKTNMINNSMYQDQNIPKSHFSPFNWQVHLL